MLKFNRIKNNCFYIEINNICICISYESLIGFYDKSNDLLFISEYYKKYSKTTTNHIKQFQKEFFIQNVNYIDNDLFYNIMSEISNKSINTILNKYIYQNDNFNFD